MLSLKICVAFLFNSNSSVWYKREYLRKLDANLNFLTNIIMYCSDLKLYKHPVNFVVSDPVVVVLPVSCIIRTEFSVLLQCRLLIQCGYLNIYKAKCLMKYYLNYNNTHFIIPKYFILNKRYPYYYYYPFMMIWRIIYIHSLQNNSSSSLVKIFRYSTYAINCK